MAQPARHTIYHDKYYGYKTADRLLDALEQTPGYKTIKALRGKRWVLVYDPQSPGAPLGLLGLTGKSTVCHYLMIEPTHLILCDCTKDRITAPSKAAVFLILSPL